ncbi:hypothetical protein B4U80_05020 [Leptotrombidium deliense]|uniref:Uncharacterized protein n=1 Tax=Leptotrombidium deliense TaxID=299467 RepID=A0A443QF62_9ACAR|nr:hypothetical protein B4U80_05020 [Leptotrombidium deliense]
MVRNFSSKNNRTDIIHGNNYRTNL